MEIIFPDIPLYKGWGKPLRTESTVEGLELIEGKVPEGLLGTWFRGGPDRQYPSLDKDDIFIDGEGMSHMFSFEEGGYITYRSRWVHTQRFLAQQKLKRAMFARYRTRYGSDPAAEGIHQGAANTSMIFHAGKLFVLKEDDLPYEMDPDTLATIGKTDLDGQVSSVSLSAHPKVDLIRNELITYSYQAKGDGTLDVVVYIFDAQGKKVHELWFESPWSGVVHDFAVTEEHIIIPFFPLITDMEAVNKGGTFYEWHPDKPTKVALIPRRGTAEDIRWFTGPNSSAGHMMNAVTIDNKVHLDLCLYDGNCFPFFKTPEGEVSQPVPPILTRMSFDLSSDDDSYTTEVINGMSGEMPKTDERYQGRPYQYGFMLTGRSPEGINTFSRFNTQTGEVESWDHGQKLSVHEVQFVPSSPDSPECVGWMLAIINCLEKGHSELAIFDAQKITAGPIARLHIPVRVRASFHGTWVPEETLRTGLYNMEIKS